MSGDFLETYNGPLKGVLRWANLDALWRTISNGRKSGWYLYAVGHDLPEHPADPEDVERFIAEVDQLLRKEHDEDYCGIVYTDSKVAPSYIKIFDPHNLGVSCGYSEKPPLPGWILSRIPPIDLEPALYPPNNRRRWWRRLFE